MTDNDWRNAKIEEAAKAIRTAHDSGLTRGYLSESRPHYSDSEVYASVAFAVFEKAHTSSDEREALAKVIDDAADAQVSPERVRTSLTLWLTDEILAAGFRRIEVPEPSAEPPLRSAWHATPAVTSRGAEPQGEPSDAQVEAALEAWEFNDGDSGKDQEGAMRAALRAAGGVR